MHTFDHTSTTQELVCRIMPYLFIATPPDIEHNICLSSPSIHILLRHTFWNYEIPFKLDVRTAIISAMRGNSQLAKEVITRNTQWLVIAVWLSPLDIHDLFLRRHINWVRAGIHVSTDLIKQPCDVVRAFAQIVLKYLSVFT